MIFNDLSGIIIILTIFIIIVLFLILTDNFWVRVQEPKCDFCNGEITNCTITVTDKKGTKVYCDPDCLEQGLKNDNTES